MVVWKTYHAYVELYIPELLHCTVKTLLED